MPNPLVYVMLSGGIDSTTALARAIKLHDSEIFAVSFDYGQRHNNELIAAFQICNHYNIGHRVIQIEMPRTMLTDPDASLPEIPYSEIKGVSPTYVPFRNGLMLARLTSYICGLHYDPLNKVEKRDSLIYWGAHAEDAENWAYPDCSNEFIGAMANAIYVGTYHRVRLVAPFANMMKHEIIREGTAYNLPYTPYELTFSCYAGGELHCGVCSTCRARKQAFDRAGISDPTAYADPRP